MRVRVDTPRAKALVKEVVDLAPPDEVQYTVTLFIDEVEENQCTSSIAGNFDNIDRVTELSRDIVEEIFTHLSPEVYEIGNVDICSDGTMEIDVDILQDEMRGDLHEGTS